MFLDPEAPAGDSVVTDKGGSGRSKETPAPAGSARVSSVGERPGYRARGAGPGVRPGSSLRAPPARTPPARAPPRPHLSGGRALLPPPSRPRGPSWAAPSLLAVVVVAVRAGSSGPKHFTIALQNC